MLKDNRMYLKTFSKNVSPHSVHVMMCLATKVSTSIADGRKNASCVAHEIYQYS